MPFTQVEPAWQAMPQAPQLLLSVRVLVQVPQEVGLSATRWGIAASCVRTVMQ